MIRRFRQRYEAASAANRRIAGSLVLITGLLLVARLLETGRELVVAQRFGVSEVVDAYVIAFLIPKFLITVIADTFAVAFLPGYVAAREQSGPRAAASLLGKATLRLSIGLLVLIVGLALSRPTILHLLAPAFDAEQLALASSIFLILLPVLLLNGCARLWAIILNAAERFYLPALAPAAAPIVGTIFLVAWGDQLGIRALAIGMVVGSLIETGLVGWRVWLLGAGTTRVVATLPLRRTMHGWWPLALSAGLMASTIPVDQYMATGLGPGSVSTLVFGNRLVMFVVGMSSMALSAVLFGRFAVLVESHSWAELRALLGTWTRVVTVVSVPLTFVLIVLSPTIVRVLFERGGFSAADTRAVAGVQALYLAQVPFYVVSTLSVRVLNALGCNRWLTGVAVANVGLNVLGNILLIPALGVKGVALSTSIVYVCSTSVLTVLVYRELARREASVGTDLEKEHVPNALSVTVDGT